MPLVQRIFLIVGALSTLVYFIRRIRKSKIKINHAIFWMVFGLILLVLSVVPESLFWISYLLGFQSPVNLLYVLIIFLMVIKLFTTTMRLSKLSEQVEALTQELAIYQLDREDVEKQKDDSQNRELTSVS